jgi:hypothetical protein
MSAISHGVGWHRAELLDIALSNIGHWWFAGMSLDGTRDWFLYRVMGAVDITNFYLLFGLDAGLIAIVLFVTLLVRSFSSLGHAIGATYDCPDDKQMTLLLWALGSTLASHAANFFAVAYFDQIYVVWFMQLAAISSLASPYLVPRTMATAARRTVNRGYEREYGQRPTATLTRSRSQFR